MNLPELKSDKAFMSTSLRKVSRDLQVIMKVSRKKVPSRWFRQSVLFCLAAFTPPPLFMIAQSPRDRNEVDETVVFWPRLDFVIPFNIDATGQAPREIQLEVSENGGRSWALESSSDVRTKQFHFKAKGDGEYQFRLKTLDIQGRSFDNPGQPLRIRVDTAKPVAKLVVDIDPRGVMIAEFEITDSALDSSSIQLAYQTEGLAQWRDIEFELSPTQNPSEFLGTGSWSIPNGTRQLVVRLTAKDKAGNPVEITRLPQLPRSAALGSSLQLASGKSRDPGDSIQLGSATANKVPASTSQAIGSGLIETQTSSLPKVEVLGPSRSSTTLDSAIANQIASKDQVIENQNKLIELQQLLNQQSIEGRGSRQASSSRLDNGDRVTLPETRTSKLPIRDLTDDEILQLKSSNPVSLVAKRTDQSVLLLDDESDRIPARAAKEVEPKPIRIPGRSPFQRDIKPLFSNSKAFSLDYNIDNDPDSPVSSVELWGTADQGQTWQLWGQDPDRQSPFDIEVETEGLFGFRMVIVGSNGLASNRPRNGDNADAWIHVDVTQPQVKILSALYGKGNEAGKMIIEYQASDEFFPERPISFLYAQTPDGPWTSIAAGARNNGRYVWSADLSLPPTIFMRLEANDSAGNVGVNQLDLPIDVEGLAPRGRIQGFRPIK